MKRVVAFILSLPVLTVGFGLTSAAQAQSCKMVTTYYTERYWTGKYWASSQMPYFHQVCDGVGTGKSSQPKPGDEVSKGRFFKDGKPYLNRKHFYGAYVVSADGKQPVELRSGPGVNYPVVDRVPSGVFLSMMGEMKRDDEGRWWTQIHTGTWVDSKSSR
jgi:hypothetical protein